MSANFKNFRFLTLTTPKKICFMYSINTICVAVFSKGARRA